VETEQILIPYFWRRGFGIARLALVFCAAVILFFAGAEVGKWALFPVGLYAAFSLAAVLRVGAGRPGLAALPLIADLSFFFYLASIVEASGSWLAAASFSLAVANAAVQRGWREVALAVACGALFLAITPSRPDLLAMAILTAGPVAFVLALYVTLLRRRLDVGAALSVHYRAQAENARGAERQRISADFHDGPLRSFISFQMHLEILRKLMERDPQAAHEELAQLQDLCRGQVTELRDFVRAMRQAETGGAGLAASIRRLVEVFEKDSGIPATFVGADIAGPEDPEVPLEVLQIVREALNNVQKHSKASRVGVGVTKSAGRIEISVEDDGCGFQFSGAFSLRELDQLRLGPVSIKRRVGDLGGDLTVESRPGRGSGLKIRIPI